MLHTTRTQYFERPSKGPNGANLYVNFLPMNYTANDLKQLFSRYGKIISTKVMINVATNMSRGFGESISFSISSWASHRFNLVAWATQWPSPLLYRYMNWLCCNVTKGPYTIDNSDVFFSFFFFIS